jgi:hypothetical protein
MYLKDLKTSGLKSTEVFDALKRKESIERKKKRLSVMQSGSIKVLALNQLSINLQSHDDAKKIGFHSEKISKQLKSAKETVKGLKMVKEHLHDDPQLRARSGKAGFNIDNFDEKIRAAEVQVKFLANVEEDLVLEMDHIRLKSEKIGKSKKSVKIHVDEKPAPSVRPFVPMRNKPALNVRIGSDSSIDVSSLSDLKKTGSGEGKDTTVGPRKSLLEEYQGGSGYFVSPRGTVRLGEFSIGERGLHTLTSFIIGKDNDRAGGSGGALSGGGFIDFLEICLLGCGASATVKEAIHVPSFTLVALKMMPIYNQEKRKHVGRELSVLCK